VKNPLLIKVVVGVVALAAFAVLFMRSLEDTRSAAYTVERQHLRNWTLSVEPAPRPTDALLVLRPPAELAASLFRQVFARAMESLNTPLTPAVPLVLRAEFDRVVGDRLTQEGLLAAARTAGLEQADITPRCLVHRRVSEPGGTRQVYFLVFDAPAVGRFREEIGLEPAELAPILFIAGAGPDFGVWLPQRVIAASDCLAPVEVAE
jgi:hypothetical protein